jgi:glycosyltransferase involved in cell wall biosynthesis
MARIVFVTSRIAPGSDGVGDYTRALAGELARNGHECLAIGLNQSGPHPWIDALAGTSLPERPSSAATIPSERLAAVKVEIERFDPNVISFQYVSYAFARRGLTWNVGRNFREIAGDRFVELNSHELWSGFDVAANLHDRVQGHLQYQLYRRFLKQLRPDVIHVSNPTYVEMLRQIGRPSSLSPLFGNVPVTDSMPAPGTEGFEDASESVWRLLFFGSIHAEWPPEPFMTRMIQAAQRANRRLVAISAGRIGPGMPVWERMTTEHGQKCRFVRLGERPADEISRLMAGADFGVSTSPMCLIGKSGTVAAMLEHDLPVIVNREYPLRGIPELEPAEGYDMFIRLDDRFESRLAAKAARPRNRQSRLPIAANRFLRDTRITI